MLRDANDWLLIGVLGLTAPMRQYFSPYRGVSQREVGFGWLVVLGLTAL